MVTGQLDLVQNGLGMGVRGFSPRYTSRRCTHGMSFGPPTRQVYFCVSHTMPSGSCSPNPEASLEPSTAAGRRGGSQDFRPGRRLERQGKARPRNAEAPEREGETPRWRRLGSARANDAAVDNAEASAFAMTVLARERTAGGGLQRAKKTTKKSWALVVTDEAARRHPRSLPVTRRDREALPVCLDAGSRRRPRARDPRGRGTPVTPRAPRDARAGATQAASSERVIGVDDESAPPFPPLPAARDRGPPAKGGSGAASRFRAVRRSRWGRRARPRTRPSAGAWAS
jgi:hypothetical protein